MVTVDVVILYRIWALVPKASVCSERTLLLAASRVVQLVIEKSFRSSAKVDRNLCLPGAALLV